MSLRSTQFPLHVRYREGRIKALSGQSGTFTRAAPAQTIDTAGRLYTVAPHVPRFEPVAWLSREPYLRLSGGAGESLEYAFELLPQAMTILVRLVDEGASSLIARVGGAAGARIEILREDDAYIARLYSDDDVQTESLDPPFILPCDLVLAMDADGRIRLSVAVVPEMAGEEWGDFTADTAWSDPAGVPAAWSDEAVLLGADDEMGSVLVSGAAVAPGVYSLPEMRAIVGMVSRTVLVSTWYVVLDPDGLIAYTDDTSIAEAGQFVLNDEPMIESFDGGAPELTPLRFYGLAGIPHVLIPEAA